MDDSTSPLLTATYTKLDGTTATDNTAIDVNKYVATGTTTPPVGSNDF